MQQRGPSGQFKQLSLLVGLVAAPILLSNLVDEISLLDRSTQILQVFATIHH